MARTSFLSLVSLISVLSASLIPVLSASWILYFSCGCVTARMRRMVGTLGLCIGLGVQTAAEHKIKMLVEQMKNGNYFLLQRSTLPGGLFAFSNSVSRV